MAKTIRQIKDAFPDAYTGLGLFSKFVNPIWGSEFNSIDLDILFITRYGERLQSPFTEHFDDGNGVSETNIGVMARTIYSINRSSWEHLWKANIAEYNPIDNTDAYITITDTHEDSMSGTAETAGTGTVNYDTERNENLKMGGTVTHTIAEETTGNTNETSVGSGNVENGIYGFNSSESVGDSKSANNTNTSVNSASSANKNYTDTETRNTTDTKTETGTNTETRNTNDKTTKSESTTGINTHEEHRRGNIGVTTSAQMINGEIGLWKWKFMNSVFSDICNYIALSIY